MEIGEEVSEEQESRLYRKLHQYFKEAGQDVTIYDRNKKGLEIVYNEWSVVESR